MSNTTIDYTLKLSAVELSSLSNNIGDLDQDDSWLENDSAQLLDQINEENISDSLETAIHNIAAKSENRLFKVDCITIHNSSKGFDLVYQNDDVTLETGDIICLAKNNLKVDILKEQVIVQSTIDAPQELQLETTTTQENDIWGEIPQNTTSHGNRFADPFANSNQSNPIHNDPLDFLYPSSANNNAQIPKTLSDFNSSSSLVDFEQHANVHSNLLHLPTAHQLPLQDAKQTKTQQTASYYQHTETTLQPTADQGNVLQDLGIDENQSTIVNKNYTSRGATFSELAPMDILDVYLEDDIPLICSPQVTHPAPQQVGYIPQQLPIENNISITQRVGTPILTTLKTALNKFKH